jgi:hypothetical protein
MTFDLERNAFNYYSDTTIPYRYLEPVGRKFVKQFECVQLFVDMETELKLAEDKWEKERAEKEEKDKFVKENALTEHKKNVFTKFKSYNKDTGNKNIMAAPKTNNIHPNLVIEEKDNLKALVKEQANRYTHRGKFVNFSFLQKVERKKVDKKFGTTFSDFKKLNISSHL